MRKTIFATASAIALAFAAPALAGGAPGASYSASTGSVAGNAGEIGSGAYSSAARGGSAYSLGASSVQGTSYSSTCSSCDAYTTVNFKSKSGSLSVTNGKFTEAEAYGFNEAEWETNVSREQSFDWAVHGNHGVILFPIY